MTRVRARSGVYGMRMVRVNITLPDELHVRARAAGLNVSRLASAAVSEELDRLAKIAELDDYLADLDRELGPPSEEEIADARRWVDHIAGGTDTDPRSGAA